MHKQNSSVKNTYIHNIPHNKKFKKKHPFTLTKKQKQKTPICSYQKTKIKNTHLHILLVSYTHSINTYKLSMNETLDQRQERKKENPRWGIGVGISGTVLDGS